MLPFSGGTPTTVDDIVKRMDQSRDRQGVEGISLLGGEPLAHAEAAAAIARAAWNSGLSVMIYTGYTLEEARALPDPAVGEALAHTDLLVDGPYLRDQPEPRRRWIGSANQRLHFFTRRYREDDPCWQKPNNLEIRYRDGELTVNGFPAASAVGFWRRPLRLTTEAQRHTEDS
jgi:anaerobic ribonucleoside-triphosphate reductase activating protein